jgi:hypothetical protein
MFIAKNDLKVKYGFSKRKEQSNVTSKTRRYGEGALFDVLTGWEVAEQFYERWPVTIYRGKRPGHPRL